MSYKPKILETAAGGTGVSNSSTITVGGAVSTANSFTTSGNFPLTLTQTASTNVTLPTSGTLATTAQIPSNPLTTKGDLFTYSSANARLAVGANNTTLIADSTQTTGQRWDYPGMSQFGVMEHWDDFIGSFSTQATLSAFTFRFIGSGGAVQADPGTGDHPGIVTVKSNSGTTDSATIISQPSGLLFGGGVMTLEGIINIPVLSAVGDRFTYRFGFGDQGSGGGAITDGAWFQYTDNANSGNWQIFTSNNTTQTSANTSTAPVAGTWARYKIECNAAGTSMAFYINGTQVGNSPITTNIPTGVGRNFGVMSDFIKSTGTTSTVVQCDLIYLRNVLTNTR